MEMKSLEALADEITSETIHTGEDTVEITKYRIRFEPADPPRLENSELKGSYTKKPLVNVDGESLFGELAILRVLQKDGWDGVWMASTFFHKIYNSMPPGGVTDLPDHAKRIYDLIVEENQGKTAGFFDVFAWKDGQYAFLEYKGKGDSFGDNQKAWTGAALRAGIKPSQLFIVAYE